ncbi:MAG: hypothetical protein QXQ24_05510 [Nitrososphaeria archaeon]
MNGIGFSERIAMKILSEKFKNIKRVRGTPRFLCDNARCEVKYATMFIENKPIIQMTENQIKNMRDDDLMIVVSSDGKVYEFKWKDRGEYCVVVERKNPLKLVIVVNENTMRKFKEIEAKLGLKKEQTFEKIVELAEMKLKEIEKNKRVEAI